MNKSDIILQRVSQSSHGTFGVLIQDGVAFAATLEPVMAIAAGTYRCERYDSPKFQKNVFLLKDVPGHEFIEIHMGNFLDDTSGCILIGEGFMSNGVGMSGVAFHHLMNVRMRGVNAFTIEIRNPLTGG